MSQGPWKLIYSFRALNLVGIVTHTLSKTHLVQSRTAFAVAWQLSHLADTELELFLAIKWLKSGIRTALMLSVCCDAVMRMQMLVLFALVVRL